MDLRLPPIYSWVVPKRNFRFVFQAFSLFNLQGTKCFFAEPLLSCRSAFLLYRIVFALSRTFLTFFEVFLASKSVFVVLTNFSAISPPQRQPNHITTSARCCQELFSNSFQPLCRCAPPSRDSLYIIPLPPPFVNTFFRFSLLFLPNANAPDQNDRTRSQKPTQTNRQDASAYSLSS